MILGLATPPATPDPARRGEALYKGKEPLRGRIRDHSDFLPPEAVRCANCHSPASTSRLAAKPAPKLDAAWLLDMRQRRGGPPSQYDQASFCEVLRSGVDPVHILIAREMPTYDLDGIQCAGLWEYLTAKGIEDASR
jgi:hypothetical protein